LQGYIRLLAITIVVPEGIVLVFMIKGVYAGSFDPPTNGHMWMIERGAQMFDELILAIGVNPEKRSMFTVPERRRMLEDATKKYGNVKVTSFENELLVNYAKSIGAKYILRGIRSYKDYEYENGMRHVNEDIDSSILMIFLMPTSSVASISSSQIKGLIGTNGWQSAVKRYVPAGVYKEIIKKSEKR